MSWVGNVMNFNSCCGCELLHQLNPKLTDFLWLFKLEVSKKTDKPIKPRKPDKK
jgi:hypothetical protein